MFKKIFLLMVFLLLFSGSKVFCGDINDFKVSTEQISDSTLKLSVSGQVKNNDGLWLLRAFYPKGVKDLQKEGQFDLFFLPSGNFEKSFNFDAKFIGGAYEFYFYKRKVTKENCKIPDCKYCKLYGYHLEDNIFYQWGRIE